MDYLFAVIVLSIASAVFGDTNNFFNDEGNTETYEIPQDEINNEILAKYEVTEIIEDIPNDATLGPIVANYTVSRPLNLATTPVTVTEITDNATSKVTNTTEYTTHQVTDTDNDTENNYLSVLHNIKAEYDIHDKENYNFNNIPHVSGIKEYFNSLKRGIVHGFNSIFHRNKFNFSGKYPSVVSGPLHFLKHWRHGGDISNRIHKRFENDDY